MKNKDRKAIDKWFKARHGALPKSEKAHYALVKELSGAEARFAELQRQTQDAEDLRAMYTATIFAWEQLVKEKF